MPSIPPPLSPLPTHPTLLSNPEYHPSPPHLDEPLLAPRPHKLTPDLPAEMARTLDSQVSRGFSVPFADQYYGSSPHTSPSLPARTLNPTPGFIVPPSTSSPGPLPPPAASSWGPFNVPQSGSAPSFQSSLPPHPRLSNVPQQPPLHRSEESYHSPGRPLPTPVAPPHSDSLVHAMASMTFSDTPQSKVSDPNGPPSLTAPLPTISSLIAALPSVQSSNNSPASKVAWSRDVINLVNRLYAIPNQADSTDPVSGPINVVDQELNNLVDIAIPLILQFANPVPVPQTLPPYVAEAIYLRATFESTGAHPKFVQQNPRTAFRDFERAARAGFSGAWFKLGRDYENFGDFPHAKDCYERGIRNNNESCLYRMGMAHLMGQLGLSSNPEAALPLLQRAATLATVEVPQPAYVFGLLLLGEFSHATIPPHFFLPLIPPGSSRDNEARRHLERAAYLNFAPAQYKLGHAYEFAQPPFPFDALLSVQYYSLASQQGEIEADMALSKWFLCGSEGSFDKDESLAFTFAEKAARKALPSAEFAMGYYMEVGVGGPKDIDAALKWYTRASQHGNTDATDRLAALSQPAPQALSRQEHDNLTETTLMRKRTQAKQRSDARGGPRHGGRQNGQQVVANIRKNSVAHRHGPAPALDRPSAGMRPINDGGFGYVADHGRRPSLGGTGIPNPNSSEGYPLQQRLPQQQQVPLSSSPGPAGDVGYRSRQASISAQGGYPSPQPQARAGSPAPGGYPSPRIPAQQYGAPPPGRPPLQQQQQPQQPLAGTVGRRPQPSTSGSPAAFDPPARPPPAKGPATFQEMGFQSQKLEDKDCVIM